MNRAQSYKVAALVFLLTALVGLSAVTIEKLGYPKFDKKNYLSDKEVAFIHPGLKVTVKGVDVAADRTVSVTFVVTDDKGLPLDLSGVTTPGVVAPRFILAYLPADQNQYVAYTTVTVTSPITKVTAIQPAADTGGKTDKVSDGTYKYTFKTKLPENYDANATHSIGMYVTRDLSEFDLPREVANEVVHFVPSAGEVKKVRDVVRTEACNNACHDPLQAHGGARRKVELCVLCHTPQNTDPDTGNTLDFKVLVHKIHRGEDLPSVKAGRPYQIIGFNQTVFDFSTVALPQDIRNCETCHTKAATQQPAYLLRPFQAACGSCHDDVNFATGAKHAGGPQASDNLCATCHIPEGELEYDASIKGAHTVPYKSKQLAGINIKIIEAINTGPGQKPTVRFTIKNNAGQPILPSDLAFLQLTLAGPTTDYKTRVTEDVRADSVGLPDGSYTYQFKTGIPGDATGTYAIGVQGHRMVKLNPGTTKEFDFRETNQDHSVTYVAVTDTTPVKRRTVVKRENCNACHENLSLHGGTRHDPEYCVMCHQPAANDGDRRPADKLPVQTIHLKFMIHRIHRGEDLTRDFTIYGFGNRPINFNDVRFPGDLRNCAKCHEGKSYEVPEAVVADRRLPTVAPREFYSPIQANAAACLACHDELDAAAHTFAMTAPFGESCAVCHGANAEFAVAKVHAR